MYVFFRYFSLPLVRKKKSKMSNYPQMYAVESEKKKSLVEEEGLWGESLTSADVDDMLPLEPTAEEYSWGGSLTWTDVDDMFPTEPTTEEDLWGGELTASDIELLSEIPVKESIKPESANSTKPLDVIPFRKPLEVRILQLYYFNCYSDYFFFRYLLYFNYSPWK